MIHTSDANRDVTWLERMRSTLVTVKLVSKYSFLQKRARIPNTKYSKDV